MLGVAAATALPSEVFPFRKIFLPENPKPVDPYTWAGLARSPYPGPLSVPLYPNGLEPFPGTLRSVVSRQLLEEEVEALQLKMFAKEISDLIRRGNRIYDLFKHREELVVTNGLAIQAKTSGGDDPSFSMKIEVDTDPNFPHPLVYLDANYKPSNLLHAPATPENVLEFIDGLEEDLS